MQPNEQWRQLGWRNILWELVRYYRALKGKRREQWLETVLDGDLLKASDHEPIGVSVESIDQLRAYLAQSVLDFDSAFDLLRTEDEALDYCARRGIAVGTTATRNLDHHQSSKALVAAVTAIAQDACRAHNVSLDGNPQSRAIWSTSSHLHVSARNLDGVIPSLSNPRVVWEIKEYWGKTSGGSKMSDAVYECQLVGRELRDFEDRTSVQVCHVVFLDGRIQWGARKSDLVRFIDLFHQGIIDYLIVGKEVETEWHTLLERLIPEVAGS
jgi:hypothetical protein